MQTSICCLRNLQADFTNKDTDMTEIIGIRFKEVGKIYYFDPKGEKFETGDKVIVETQNGIELVTVVLPNRMIDETFEKGLKPVVRRANKRDIETAESFKSKEADAFKICEKKIAENGLDMKLVDVEYSFDGTKIIFFFTADGRVDFRQLVRDLAAEFKKTRIELRQISTRDQCKMIGGLGTCGRPFCCKTFLGDFQPVTIKMAKEQGFALNPTKISGACGRLMCCLKYEQESYEYLAKITPKKGAHVKTPDGIGTVIDLNLISGWLRVQLDDQPDSTPIVISREDVKIVSNN